MYYSLAAPAFQVPFLVFVRAFCIVLDKAFFECLKIPVELVERRGLGKCLDETNSTASE